MAIAEVMDRLAACPEPVAEQIVVSLVAEIPAYAALSPEVLGDVRAIATLYVVEAARGLREQREPSAEQMAGFAESARARARDGLSLEDVLHALRLGFAVLWRDVHRRLAADGRDFDAAMDVGTRFMRYFDLAAGVVARHYLDERERLTASADRRHGELIAVLLHEGVLAARDLAQAEHVRLAPRYWAVLLAPAVPPVPANSGQHEGILPLGAAALARTLRRLPVAAPVLATVDGDAVLALWPALPGDSRATLERAHHALAAEHGPLLMAVAGPAAENLAAPADEVRALRRVVGGGPGVYCLEDVLLDAVIRQTSGRAAQAVRALADQLPGELRQTIAAYVEAGMSVRETARALTVHRNTVLYRLSQIERATGRDPRDVRDLFLLHAALRLFFMEGGPAQGR